MGAGCFCFSARRALCSNSIGIFIFVFLLQFVKFLAECLLVAMVIGVNLLLYSQYETDNRSKKR